MYEKDDNIVSPRDWCGNGSANNRTTRPQQCHTEICKPGSNKSTMRKTKAPPSQEPRDHREYAHRSMDRIHRPVMTYSCGSWKLKMRGGETNCENRSKVKRQETTGGQGPLTCALSIISLEGLVLLPEVFMRKIR